MAWGGGEGLEDHTDAVKRLLRAKDRHPVNGLNSLHSALPERYLKHIRKSAVSVTGKSSICTPVPHLGL